MQQVGRYFALALTACLLVQCGSDDGNAVAPGPIDDELIGSWRFESTNLVVLSSQRLAGFLSLLGIAQQEIEANVAQLERELGDSEDFFRTGDIFELRANSTWEEADGHRGTWRAAEGQLHLVDRTESPASTSFAYSVAENRLTLVWTAAQLQTEIWEDEGAGAETTVLFDSMLMEDDAFEFVFVRVE